jgi:CubicO group peptidase (beta-lactamase class C family)
MIVRPLLALSVLMTTSMQAQATPASQIGPAIDSLLSAYSGPRTPGASVLVVQNGNVVHQRAYGLANIEDNVRATTHTNYRLASLTKQFTAASIMLLVHDGKLTLDTPVIDLLPELPAYARSVRVRHLLTHTSGLWAYEDFVPDSQTRQVHDRDALMLIKQADSTHFPPGSAYRYSNTGYALLALIVEKASGKRFATFLHDRIFAPLGMRATVAYEAGVSEVPNRAFGYTTRQGGAVRTDQSSTSAVLGDGGIYTSIEDLVKWDAALTKGTLIDPALWKQATTPATLTDGKPIEYGFGWFIDRYHGHLRNRHHGETRGFTNAIARFPDDHLTIVVLTNRTGGAPWDIAEKIADLFIR